MNKNVMNVLLAASVIGTNEYAEEYLDNMEDPEVSKCLTYMYLWMMSTGNYSGEKQAECYNKFAAEFNKLNPTQQETVRTKYSEVVQSSQNSSGARG